MRGGRVRRVVGRERRRNVVLLPIGACGKGKAAVPRRVDRDFRRFRRHQPLVERDCAHFIKRGLAARFQRFRRGRRCHLRLLAGQRRRRVKQRVEGKRGTGIHLPDRVFHRVINRVVDAFFVGETHLGFRGVHVYVHRTGRNDDIQDAGGKFARHGRVFVSVVKRCRADRDFDGSGIDIKML